MAGDMDLELEDPVGEGEGRGLGEGVGRGRGDAPALSPGSALSGLPSSLPDCWPASCHSLLASQILHQAQKWPKTGL